MNMAFFTIRNVLVITAFVLLFHIATNPIHEMLDGSPDDEGA